MPIFTHKASRNKLSKVYEIIAHLIYFQKSVPPYTFTFFLTCSIFGNLSLFLPLPHFAPYPLPRPPKTFLNILAAPSSAVFCSNAVLIKIISCSMQFFSFFDVLLSSPASTRIVLKVASTTFLVVYFLSLKRKTLLN